MERNTNEYKKIVDNRNLPIHQDIEDANHNRLRSRRPPTKTARIAVEVDLQTHGLKNGLHNKTITCRASPTSHRVLIYHVKHGPCLTESELNMADVHTLYTNEARNHLLSVIAEKSRLLDISQKNVPYDHIMVDQKTS